MKKIAYLLVVLLLSCLNWLQAQIILNGSFEQSSFDPTNFIELSIGNTTVNNWNIVSGNIDYVASFWESSAGTHSIDMTGTLPGAISQSFSTTIGEVYCVSFDMAGNMGADPIVKELNVSVAAVSNNFIFDVTGHTRTTMGWAPHGFEFVAIDTVSNLTFTSLVTGNAGPAIDNVQVIHCPLDCMGTPSGIAVIDKCGVCLEPTDLNFNQSCPEIYDVFIPNIFSPNGDGFNDQFQIYKRQEQLAQINNFLIFDRNGSLLYALKNLEFNATVDWWDGQFKGQELQHGVYVYYIEIEFETGVVRQYKGAVTIVK